MIVVEGPDGGGKTTLCNQLQRDFDLSIERPQRGGEAPVVPVRNRVYRALSRSVKGHQEARIYDRLYFSELVYGKVLRKHVEFSAFEQIFVTDVLRALKPVIVFCLPDFDNAQKNLVANPQLWGVEENYRKIYHEYELHNDDWGIHYDYERPNHYKRVTNAVAEYLQERTLREW